MAIEEQANNAIPTGGVTDVAENPNEVQVAGLGKTIVDIFEALLRPADDAADASKKITAEKPPPQNVANQVPTPIAEDAILTGKKTYGKTADYWAKRTLSPAGYRRWLEQNKEARVPKPADVDVMDTANRAIDDLEADAPIVDNKRIADVDSARSVLNINEVIRSDGKGGIDFNFSKLKTGDDVLTLINAVSDIYKDPTKAAKRGVVTNKETIANASDLLADELGLTRKLFKQGRGATMNAAEMVAVRNLIVKSATNLYTLAKQIRTQEKPSAELMLRFRRQLAIHAGIQAKAKAAQTEIARALQSFNIPVGMRTETDFADAAETLLKESGGRDLTNKMVKGLIKVAEQNGRKGINKFARDGFFAKTGKVFHEVYINGLLSWTTTHLKNAIATPLFQVYQLPEEILAGTFGTIERGIRKGLNASRGVNDGVYLGQAFARVYGWSKAFKEAWLVAGKTLRTEVPASVGQKVEHTQFRAIDSENLGSSNFWSTPVDMLGKIIRLPGRGLQTADDFWKTIAQRGELHTQAYIAKQTSLRNGDDIATANDNALMIMLDPRSVAKDLDHKANYATLTSDPGFVGKFTNAVQSTFLGRILLPFARVPTNAVIRASERVLPLSLINPKQYKRIFGSDPAERQKALAQLSFTSGTLYMFAEWAGTGKFTGSYPESENQRKLLPPGWQPYSMVFRDKSDISVWEDDNGDLKPLYDEYGIPNGPLKYIKYSGLEPVGAIIGISVDYVERMRRTDDPIMRDNWASALAFASMDYFTNLPFLQSVGDISKALEYDDISYLIESPLENTLGILPKPYSGAVRNIYGSVRDPELIKVSETIEYYTIEDVRAFPKIKNADGKMVYEATGTEFPPYQDIGKPKKGTMVNRSIENIWQTQTKDIPFFGEDDVYAVQYDVLGNPKVSNTARFDVRPGEALWNLITPFDIKRGEEPEEWQKTLYRIGMPLSFKRDQLNGIRLSEKQKSDWVRIAKNEVYEKIGNQPPLKFKAALRYLVSTIAFKKYDLTKQQNLVRSLEDKFYKKAVQTLLRLEGNEQLRAVYDDREYYKNDLKQRIIINP